MIVPADRLDHNYVRKSLSADEISCLRKLKANKANLYTCIKIAKEMRLEDYGIYSLPLKHWFESFPQDQIHIMQVIIVMTILEPEAFHVLPYVLPCYLVRVILDYLRHSKVEVLAIIISHYAFCGVSI